MAKLPKVGSLYAPPSGALARVFAVVTLDGVHRITLDNGATVDLPIEPDIDEEAALARAKSLADARIAQAREVAIASGIMVPGLGRVQTDPESLRNIGIKVRAALKAKVNGEPYSTVFRLEDNTDVPIDGAQLLDLDDLIDAAGTACYVVSWQKKAAVAAATTIAEVDAVIAGVNEGWPG